MIADELAGVSVRECDHQATRIETAYAGKQVTIRLGKKPRLLLDTNVWNYLAAADLLVPLRMIARRCKVAILVAPAALYEAFEYNSQEDRIRRAKLLTDPAWARLMPEAYSECGEILGEMRRVMPGVLAERPDLVAFHLQRRDWTAKARGAWDRAAENPARFAELSAFPDKERATQLAHDRRNNNPEPALNVQAFRNNHTELASLKLGGTQTLHEAWRVQARNATFWHCDSRNRSTAYFDWLQPFLGSGPIDPRVTI